MVYLNNSLLSIIPAVVYTNADTQKLDILKDNKGKSGIYPLIGYFEKITYQETGESYVGSAINLSKRFRIYYSLLSIEKILNKSKSHILSAILKYCYSKFTLEILEYCDSKDLINREQHYIDLLKPEYNILKKAGSLLGSEHIEETRTKMSITQKAVNRSEK